MVPSAAAAAAATAAARAAAAAVAALADTGGLPAGEPPLVSVAGPVGYAPWVPGQPRRLAWPLFGTPAVPDVPPAHEALARRLWRRGARYLGDETDLLRPEAGAPRRSGEPGGAGGRGAAGGDPGWLEIAFVGRSNVGKSTLLNSLLGSADNAFVPVSRTPGHTTGLDFYGVGAGPAPPRVVVVDTPGYGFSVRGKGVAAGWHGKIEAYLRARSPAVLTRVVLLLDARQGVADLDRSVMDALDEAFVPWQVALTKADAVTDAALETAALGVATELGSRQLAFPVLHAVSARTGAGVAALCTALVGSAKLHKVA